MRSKRDIEILTANAPSTVFPQPLHWTFDTFRVRLNEVLEENGLGGNWEYIPGAREFSTTWEEKTLINGLLIVITERVSLYLEGELLADEIERLIGHREALTERAQAMFRVATGADVAYADPKLRP